MWASSALEVCGRIEALAPRVCMCTRKYVGNCAESVYLLVYYLLDLYVVVIDG